MSSGSNFKTWEMQDEAIAMYTPKHGLSEPPFKLYIPLLMPRIPMGLPKRTSISLSKSCYINASDCKPAISGSLMSQNYITTPMYDNRSFKEGYFWHGDKMKVLFFNNNPDQRFVDDKLDNSADCAVTTHPEQHVVQ